MNENTYKIRKTFLIPLISIAALLFLLLFISLLYGRKSEIIVVIVLFFASLAVSVNMFRKEITVSDQGVKIKKVFRCVELGWTEITHLGVVVFKKKVYFLLTTTKGFHIFSDLVENHTFLVRYLVDKLSEEKVEVEVKQYLEHPLKRQALIVMSWFAVVIIIAVIILKLSEISI